MKSLLLVITIALSTISYAQEDLQHSEDSHRIETHKKDTHKRFRIAAAMSQSYIPELRAHEETTSSQFIPTNGIEIEYCATDNLYLKWVNEIEFLSYTVIKEDGEHAHRENAYLTAFLVGYKVMPHLGLFAGAGYELEKNENLYVCRMGAEYMFEIYNHWSIVPSIMYDVKSESHTAYTFSFTIGKHF